MSRLVNYRDSLDATAALGAGPAGSVEQEAADLPVQAGSHLTPLAAPHNSRCDGESRELENLEMQLKSVRERLQNVSFFRSKLKCPFCAHQTGKQPHMLMCLKACSVLMRFLLN